MKQVGQHLNPGISMLLVTFIVLCLVVFSMLTLSTARNDYDQSMRAAQHRADYCAEMNDTAEKLAGK